jgi:hypothetical protein
MRADLIGVNALKGEQNGTGFEPPEVRVRVAAKTRSRRDAQRIGEEVENLYTNGPAGGGGAFKSVREVVALVSGLVPADQVRPEIHHVPV